MPTEEQLVNNFDANMYGPSQNIKVGQKLPIMARTVSKLAFLLLKAGSPTGDVTFTIRRSSTKAIIASKVLGDASAITYVATWYEATLDSPVDVNEEAIIMVEFSGGNASNYVRCREQLSDVKAGENDNRYGTSWENNTGVDCAYKYTYELTLTSPTVTIQAMTDMAGNTATAHGNVTALGYPDPTQHGHCWNTTGSPTIADSKTELGSKSATGAFESELTGLSPNVTYYVRAYATNAAGTSYSSEISFTTRTGYSQLHESLLSPDDDQGSVYDDAWNAQVFTPSTEHPILKVKLKLYRVGSPGTLTVSIRAVSSNKPTGVDLCYGTIDGNALTTDTAGEWVEIEFDLGTIQDLLAAGTKYAIVFRAPSGSTPSHVVFFRGNANYTDPGGQRCTSSNSGSSWTHIAQNCILYEEWGILEAPVILPTVTTNPASNIGPTTVTLNGTLDDDGNEACDCGFEYGETTDYGTTTDTESKTTDETFSQAVRGLKGGTVYHFRAIATNSAETGRGADRTFHTEALSAEAHQALGKGYPLSRAEI